MQQFLEYPKPMVDLYDALYTGPLVWGDDRKLYHELAKEFGGPVLELAVGTGRVTRYLAEQGAEVVGLEISPRMLEQARQNIAKLPDEVQQRITLVQGDMREFELGKQFPLIIIPFSAFQHVLTLEEQLRTFQCIRRHLTEGGRFAVDLFDPRLELCVPRAAGWRGSRGEPVHPETGRKWRIFVDSRENLVEQQMIHEDWRLVELTPDGQALSQYSWRLTLRWTYRFEAQHLFERSGFTGVNLWGDYQRGPFTYAQRQVWLVKKA